MTKLDKIYKRDAGWLVDATTAVGGSVRRAFKTSAEAEAWLLAFQKDRDEITGARTN